MLCLNDVAWQPLNYCPTPPGPWTVDTPIYPALYQRKRAYLSLDVTRTFYFVKLAESMDLHFSANLRRNTKFILVENQNIQP